MLNTTTEYLVLGADKNHPLLRQSEKTEWQKRELLNIADSLNRPQLDYLVQIARAYKAGTEKA